MSLTNYVLNGDFSETYDVEVGEFTVQQATNWTLTMVEGDVGGNYVSTDPNFSDVSCYFLGSNQRVGVISQEISGLTPNTSYKLVFYMYNQGCEDSEAQDNYEYFEVIWNGTNLGIFGNPYESLPIPSPIIPWTRYILDVTSSGPGMTNTLSFGARQDPQYYELTYVSLTETINENYNTDLWVPFLLPFDTTNGTLDPPILDPPTVISDVCFIAGTPVLTDQGIVNIEKINIDVHTIRGKPILAVTKSITTEKSLVCFEKDALGFGYPSQRTIMSQKHQVLYKRKMIEAGKFVNRKMGVYAVPYHGEILYNVLLEKYSKMCVNGMTVETLHPKSDIAKIYNKIMDDSDTNEEICVLSIDQLMKQKKYEIQFVKNTNMCMNLRRK
jgi:hypothetical protein